MKAIVRDTYGSPDVLELRDIDKPEIADDEEVLVHVHAAGVGRDVWHVIPARPRLPGDARHHRRRDRWTVARRHRSPAPGARAVPVRGPEAGDVRLVGEPRGPGCS